MYRIQMKPLTLGLLAAGAVTLAALGLMATQSNAQTKAPAVAPKPALTVTIAQARTGVLPVTLSANGSVMAWQEAIVGAEIGGLQVRELNASVGDSVKRGQVLATFSADSVQADVAMARAALAESAAGAAEATANADRARAVQGTGALSAQQVSQYLSAELVAQARVASAKAALDAQTLRLKYTQVLAPDDGTITARNATVGSVVGAGSEMFRLIRRGRLEWRADVTSAELGRIAPGTSVVVTSPGGSQVKGKVRMVSPTVDAQTRNGQVFVDLMAASAGGFKQGMFARGEFDLGRTAALSVVQSAVLVRDGFSYVMRVGTDNRVAQVKVQTGRHSGDQVELLSGIKPEDRLVATGAGFLAEGDVVRVVDAAPAQAAAK